MRTSFLFNCRGNRGSRACGQPLIDKDSERETQSTVESFIEYPRAGIQRVLRFQMECQNESQSGRGRRLVDRRRTVEQFRPVIQTEAHRVVVLPADLRAFFHSVLFLRNYYLFAGLASQSLLTINHLSPSFNK